ncbi:unnamed protein product, partial [Ascophyllum nodosum]
MPERSRSSYINARTLQNLGNFSGESQEWHVIGSHGVTARETERLDSSCVGVLPFACLLTVTDKIGRCLKISSPGAKTTKDRALVLLLPSLVRLRLIMLPRVAAAWRSGPVRAFHHCNFLENVPVVGWVPVADTTGYVLLAEGGLNAGV